MTWYPHRSDAEYWRDDNPLIVIWHRFGDDYPANNYVGDTPEDHLSGLFTDSSMTRGHIMSRTTPSNLVSPTSGIAPWSSSGMIFDGAGWLTGVQPNVLGYHAHISPNDAAAPHMRFGNDSAGYGYHGFGTKTMHSGLLVAGWMQLETPGERHDVERIVWGDITTNRDGGDSRWAVNFVYDDSGAHSSSQYAVLRFILRNTSPLSTGGNNGNSAPWNTDTRTSTVDNAGTPYPLPIGEPFFFAYTVHRELHPETQSPMPHEQNPSPFSNNGSGLLTMYLGTYTSGLFKVAEHLIADADLGNSSLSTQQFALGNWADQLAGGVNKRGVPRGTIMDEFIVVHDGYITPRRIAHYMNSGIITTPADNPERPEFAPQLPGTNGLQAYFTWDNNDSMEEIARNTAPGTSGLFNSIMGTADRPCPGVRGGSGLQLETQFLRLTTDWTPGFNASKWHVPVGSGRHYMFPDINRAKGFTWIGWMKPAYENNTIFSPAVGWFSEATEHHAWGPSNWNNGATTIDGRATGAGNYQPEPGGTNFSVSGSIATNLFDTDNSTGGLTNVGPEFGTWSLWAFVVDFERGVSYFVKDAKHVVLNPLQIAPGSGWTDERMLGNTNFNAADRTTEGAAFTFSECGAWSLNPTEDACVDDWACYDRVLSLPEMSGFALSGIAETPPIPTLDTSFKQVLGFWPLNGSGTYDLDGLNGIRFEDRSWYRHYLTNVSGHFSAGDPLNDNIDDDSVQVDTSGGMISLERVFTGSNLDFSSEQVMGPSGFSAGMWAYVPSGDLGSQGNGSSGLYDLHVLMGNYGQQPSDNSWIIGIEDNILQGRVTLSNLIETTIPTNTEVPFNTPFFIGLDVQPSGSNLIGRMWYSTTPDDQAVTQIGPETTLGVSSLLLNPASASGFSLFNAPNQQYGFPSQTRGQSAFVYAGAFPEYLWGEVKNLGIYNNSLGADAVSSSDPDNISHWKLDRQGTRFIDFGKEQNFLFPINTDGNLPGTIVAIHSSGVVIRQPEYYDTLAGNPNSSRLDLGSGTQSWTFLGWVFPPAVTNQDRHYFMAKSDGASGIQVYTPDDSLQLTTNASGATSLSQNGDLAPSDWSHIAIVYDRDNNEFTTVINGRYAGPGFLSLPEVPTNNSGMALGGRGDQNFDALAGGSAFSGYLDDVMIFSRALTLPEISGLAANSYDFSDGSTEFTGGPVGAYLSGIAVDFVSGLIGSFIYGQAQDLELIAGYVSGVSGAYDHVGGFMHGKAQVSGQYGAFLHGAGQQSGVFGHFVHGLDIVSGFIGSYMMGACEGSSEFDITLNFRVVSFDEFDARLGVEKTRRLDFDARLGIIRVTEPPDCTLELPLVGTIVSGLPYELTVTGSGIARDDKKVSMVRFTFADFKGAESGTLVEGVPNSGLYSATRVFDTVGLYNVKIEVLDSYGYRTSCVRPFLLIPSGTPSGTFLNSLPGIAISGTPVLGSAIQAVSFVHSLSGIDTTSGLLEYTDFADQQETLVNSLEMPSGTQFVDFVRRHDYTMPGRFAPVWSVSGEFGIVSDTIADGIDYIV